MLEHLSGLVTCGRIDAGRLCESSRQSGEAMSRFQLSSVEEFSEFGFEW